MSHAVQSDKPNIPSSAAFWSVLIFVGLIIAAVNFTRVMGSHDEGHGGGHGAATEHHDAAAGHGDHGTEHGAAQPEHAAQPAAAGHDDSAVHGEAHAAPKAEAHPAKEEAHH
jgi:hypothetical protein